jgi:hypothetical protein
MTRKIAPILHEIVTAIDGIQGAIAGKTFADFQKDHHCSVDVAHGLALLFGIGTRALSLWDSRTRRNNLSGGLTVSVTAVQADIRTHLIHRPARDIIPPLGGARVFSYRN